MCQRLQAAQGRPAPARTLTAPETGSLLEGVYAIAPSSGAPPPDMAWPTAPPAPPTDSPRPPERAPLPMLAYRLKPCGAGFLHLDLLGGWNQPDSAASGGRAPWGARARRGTPPSFIQRPSSCPASQGASCAQCQDRPTATNCSWQPSASNLRYGASGLLQIRKI